MDDGGTTVSGTTSKRYVDRTGWPAGPWDDEPDKVQWQDAATGLPCIARRTPAGFWCGYVAVPPGHPLHGTQDTYGAAEGLPAHGGITYAAGCDGDQEYGICHKPSPGEPDDVWWFGFDCAHAWDSAPSREFRRYPNLGPRVYRTLDYVRDQCATLALALASEAEPRR